MGLWNWLRTQATGVDLDAEQARANDLDARLRAENSVDYAVDGPIWTRAFETAYAKGIAAGLEDFAALDYAENIANGIADTVQAHMAQQEADSANLGGQVNRAFVEGAGEGLASMQSTFKRGLEKIGLGALGFIPWWFWPLALIALFLYLGGGNWVRKKVASL